MGIEHRLSRNKLSEELRNAFPGVGDSSWNTCNTILAELNRGIVQEINPEYFRFVLLSSAARQIVKPSPMYHPVRSVVRRIFDDAFSDVGIPHDNPAMQRTFTALKEMSTPDIDIAILLFSAEAVDPTAFMQSVTRLSCDAGGLNPETFQVPTNKHITVTNFSLSENPLDPTMQFFPFIIFGDSSTEYVDKRLGWCTTPGTRRHISLLPHGDPWEMYLFDQDMRVFRERLDEPDIFRWQGDFDDLDLLEALLRGFQVKAMYSPEIEPFEPTSQQTIADFVSTCLTQFSREYFCDPYKNNKLILFMKQLLCTRLSGQDYFRNQILCHPEYGRQMTDLVNTISAIQHNDAQRFVVTPDTLAGLSDGEFASHLFGPNVEEIY